MVSITPETQNHAQAMASSLGNSIGRFTKALELLQFATNERSRFHR
jgi:hypothetical protein